MAQIFFSDLVMGVFWKCVYDSANEALGYNPSPTVYQL